MSISEADVEALIAQGAVIRGEFRWRRVGRTRLKAEVALVETYDAMRVRLIGTYNTQTKGLSYTLVVGGCRVRSLDAKGPPHQNPSGEILQCPHKHKWTDAHQDKEAYVPTDITAVERREILIQFLTECNIQFLGAYEDYHEQQVLL